MNGNPKWYLNLSFQTSCKLFINIFFKFENSSIVVTKLETCLKKQKQKPKRHSLSFKAF